MKKIYLALAKGNLRGARTLLNEKFRNEHHQAWLKDMQDEYDVLFPTFRIMTDDEYEVYINELDDGSTILPQEETKVEIDYSEDENYKTFEEHINETRTISEATETELEVTELVRPYVGIAENELTDKITAFIQPTVNRIAKEKKQKLLESMQVEIGDIAFQADVTSMTYMTAVGVIASKYFAKALADGVNAEDAYKAIYQDITIDWKDAKNEVNSYNAENIVGVLEVGIKKVAEVVGV